MISTISVGTSGVKMGMDEVITVEEINGIKKKLKDEFHLEEEPLFFYFNQIVGTGFIHRGKKDTPENEKQNRPSYVDDTRLKRLIIDVNSNENSNDFLMKRLEPEGKFIFYTDIKILSGKARGNIESFAMGVISSDPYLDSAFLNNLTSYAWAELQDYSLIPDLTLAMIKALEE